MLELTLPWWELMLRGAVLYLTVIVLVRVTGKRQIGELTPFDLVLITFVGAAASRGLRGEEASVTGALIVIGTMLMLNMAIGKLIVHWRPFERALEGRPILLIREGKVDYAQLRREHISKNELLMTLRQQGCMSPHEAEYAVLETSGKISVKKREEGKAA